jgi:hypothetical protein
MPTTKSTQEPLPTQPAQPVSTPAPKAKLRTSVKAGALNPYVPKVPGEKQGALQGG